MNLDIESSVRLGSVYNYSFVIITDWVTRLCSPRGIWGSCTQIYWSVSVNDIARCTCTTKHVILKQTTLEGKVVRKVRKPSSLEGKEKYFTLSFLDCHIRNQYCEFCFSIE